MRIVLTANFSPWSPYSGGAQRSTHSLATALVARGHEVTVIYTKCLGENIRPPSPPAYRIRWAPFVGLRSRRAAPLRPLNVFTVAAVVADEVRRGPIDAVHGQGEEAAAVPSVRGRSGFRFVMTPRYPDYPASLLRPGGATPLERIRLSMLDTKYLLLGRAVRRADACSATSRSSAAMVGQAFGLDLHRIVIVPNGVDEAFFGARWQPGPGPRPLVFFGRLDRGKGASTLLEAVGLLGPAAPPCLIIGRGDEEAALRRRAAELGRDVRLLPWSSARELATLLAGAALAVLPSREESFGNSVAEAMAVGAPVLTTTAGSLPELVEHGVSGWLVPPGDPLALAEAIRHLLAEPDLAASLGAAARALAEARYRWDAVAAAHEPLYGGSSSQ